MSCFWHLTARWVGVVPQGSRKKVDHVRDIRVASVQFEHLPGDKQANLAKITCWARLAASAGAQILVSGLLLGK